MYVYTSSFLNYNQTLLRPSILSILTWLLQNSMNDSNLLWRVQHGRIALELVSLVTLSSGILYVLQELIQPMDGFMNHNCSSVRMHLGTSSWNSAMIRSPKWSFLQKGSLVMWLSWLCHLIIMSFVGRLHGFKVTTLMYLLFASDSVCIFSKQIAKKLFCKCLNQHVNNKTPLHRWGSFQVLVPASKLPNAQSQSWGSYSDQAIITVQVETFWVSVPCQHMWQGGHCVGNQ